MHVLTHKTFVEKILNPVNPDKVLIYSLNWYLFLIKHHLKCLVLYLLALIIVL